MQCMYIIIILTGKQVEKNQKDYSFSYAPPPTE